MQSRVQRAHCTHKVSHYLIKEISNNNNNAINIQRIRVDGSHLIPGIDHVRNESQKQQNSYSQEYSNLGNESQAHYVTMHTNSTRCTRTCLC